MSASNSTSQVEYRTIPGFPGYLIGSDGTVWSQMTPQDNGRGRLRINLRVNGREVSCQIHRLLLLAFVGPCPEGQEARHLDDDPMNNSLDNLCWGTREENNEDKRRNGKVACGARIHCAKLTDDKVRRLRRLRHQGWSYAKLGRKFGVSKETVYYACVGRTWRHVKEDCDEHQRSHEPK